MEEESEIFGKIKNQRSLKLKESEFQKSLEFSDDSEVDDD